MNKLLGTEIIQDPLRHNRVLFDVFKDWEWWHATGLAKREVYTDGTVKLYEEFVNSDGIIRYNIKLPLIYTVDTRTRLA